MLLPYNHRTNLSRFAHNFNDFFCFHQLFTKAVRKKAYSPLPEESSPSLFETLDEFSLLDVLLDEADEEEADDAADADEATDAGVNHVMDFSLLTEETLKTPASPERCCAIVAFAKRNFFPR